MILKNSYAILIMSTVLAAVSSAHAVESFDDAIKNGTTSGQFRLGYISVAPDVAGEKTTTGAALGGHIKFETAKWNRLQFAIAPYFSEKISLLSGDAAKSELNGDFLDSNNQSFAYFGEAYFNYALENGQIRYGRQLLETPFINTDDLRMLPHTFEALWVNFSPLKNLELETGWVSRWAGFNTGGDQHKYKEAGVEGVFALGANYASNDELKFQAWYYDVRESYQILYGDLNYLGLKNLELGFQYGNYTEENASNTDGSVIGVMASYNLKPVTITLAYNKTDNDTGKSVSTGLGVGNFYTTMDDSHIADKNDAVAYRVGLDYAFSEDTNLGLFYGHFEDANTANFDLDEWNLIFTHQVTKLLDVEYILAVHENDATPNDVSTNQTRNLLRINYIF